MKRRATLSCLPSRSFALAAMVAISANLLGTPSSKAEEPGMSRLILTNLATAPFPHRSRSEGHTYQGKRYPAELHYQDNRVAISIPVGYRPTQSVDFVVHFHGWFNNVTNTLQQFELASQLEASGRQAVLVVPEGPKNAPDSSGGRLEEPGAFRALMEDVLRVVRSELGQDLQPGRITLSGHSGAYRVIGWILKHGGLEPNIREVFLFDAIYAQTDQFAAWAAKESHRLVAIYTEGGGTLAETANLKTKLRAQGTPFLESEDPGTSTGSLRAQRVVFLHSDLGHNDVVAKRRHFETFLATGSR